MCNSQQILLQSHDRVMRQYYMNILTGVYFWLQNNLSYVYGNENLSEIYTEWASHVTFEYFNSDRIVYLSHTLMKPIKII